MGGKFGASHLLVLFFNWKNIVVRLFRVISARALNSDMQNTFRGRGNIVNDPYSYVILLAMLLTLKLFLLSLRVANENENLVVGV